MRLSIILLNIFFLLCFSCVAQTKTSDSLKNLLKQQKTPDTNYVKKMYDMARTLYDEGDLQAAKKITRDGIEISEKLKWPVGRMWGFLGLNSLLSEETKFVTVAFVSVEFSEARLEVAKFVVVVRNFEFVYNNVWQSSIVCNPIIH